MSDPKIDQFLALVDHGHYGRAAEALGLSQQAVSKTISALEKQYGVKLFNRGAFGATPTAFGEVLATRARLARAELTLAQSEIDAMRGSRYGQVRVGVGLCFAGRIMPQSIARFRKRYPKVHVTAIVESSAALFPMMLAGGLDFCVSAPPPDFPIDPDLSRETIQRELDKGEVVSINIERIPQERPAILTCRQRSTLSPAAANLARIIREICIEHYGAPTRQR